MLRSRISLPAVVLAAATLVAVTPAAADIYTWVDANGATTVSNLPPPEGARVSRVTRESPDAAASAAAAREAAREAEVRALASRVRDLEADAAPPPVAFAPPPAAYAPVTYVPVPQPIIVTIPQPEPVMPAWPSCDPLWYGCGWSPAWYPASVFVVPAVPARPVRPRSPYRQDPNIPHRPPPLPHQVAVHPAPLLR